MAVDPNDPFLKRVLKAKNKQHATAILEAILVEESMKYADSLRGTLIKQFGINAAYMGKRAVDKVWEWFQPPMDFSAQPDVMQGSTITMSLGLGQENTNAKVQKKAGDRRGKKNRGARNVGRNKPRWK